MNSCQPKYMKKGSVTRIQQGSKNKIRFISAYGGRSVWLPGLSWNVPTLNGVDDTVASDCR